ncbi:polyprenyl synthetase family protein [Arachnia propionica]|uniref:Polyprenyl synthetase family protein n=1 Tax=Arachnia propionica TaxID=1750 RepID=A0A3P1TBJ9_9ACTN|nr:polyprenyl synthetase family protein [Arachnia propionica]RRD06585.1 polyprenyl synthetase family protein [Arachnia propionica]
MPTPFADDPLAPAFTESVAAAITTFLDSRTALAEHIGALPVLEQARVATSGGKRLRPAFCYWGHAAVARPDDHGALIRAASSLELLHASLLVHDDLIDASDTRRGMPAAHRAFAATLGGERAEAFGVAAAILTGDVLFDLSVTMFESSGLTREALERGRPVLQEMRHEVLLGQYVDVAAGFDATGVGSPEQLLEQAERVLEYKSARYSVARPLQLGASLAGGTITQVAALGAFGSLIGQAFQLRDDVLGVFGDPEVTGKPAGDDLREGKRTVLVLAALGGSDDTDRDRLLSVLGHPTDPAGIDRARRIIMDSGALQAVESRIEASHAQALAQLRSADLSSEAVQALTQLAERAIHRDR